MRCERGGRGGGRGGIRDGDERECRASRGWRAGEVGGVDRSSPAGGTGRATRGGNVVGGCGVCSAGPGTDGCAERRGQGRAYELSSSSSLEELTMGPLLGSGPEAHRRGGIPLQTKSEGRPAQNTDILTEKGRRSRGPLDRRQSPATAPEAPRARGEPATTPVLTPQYWRTSLTSSHPAPIFA